MSRRLLLIQEASNPLASVLEDGTSDIRYTSTEWTTFSPTAMAGRSADLVVAVAVPTNEQALGFFRWLREHPMSTPILAVVPGGLDPELLETVVHAVDDFMLWPASRAEWWHRVARILGPPDADPAATTLLHEVGMTNLAGYDARFLGTIAKLPLLARSGLPVLITGETGTGKEMCARAIHLLGRRRSFPFIPVDCGALPDHLFENELFGHARGAFTDAHADHRGLVALAEGGTLFLDEIDALSLPAQAKLLRFLEDRTYRPLGAERFCRADVNVLAASNQDLEALVRRRQFRRDLYFRLNVLRADLPPLRERRGDVEVLAQRFLASLCAEAGLGHKTLTPPALRKLAGHDWPGNVRELLNVLQRAVVSVPGPQILPADLVLSSADPGTERAAGCFSEARTRAIEAFERRYVEDLLRKHQGNVTRASREAQHDRRAFGRLIKRYHIDRLQL
jgi:DNA-binding NtrC family response regulator